MVTHFQFLRGTLTSSGKGELRGSRAQRGRGILSQFLCSVIKSMPPCPFLQTTVFSPFLFSKRDALVSSKDRVIWTTLGRCAFSRLPFLVAERGVQDRLGLYRWAVWSCDVCSEG